MDLIPCPDCRREMAASASICPHCGFSMEYLKYVLLCFSGQIPADGSARIALKMGEVAYYSSPVSVLGSKTQTISRTEHIGTRVSIGGVPLYYGASAPVRESREVVAAVGRGYFVVTNQRIVITGNKTNCSIPLSKLLDWELFFDGIQLFNEGRTGGRFYLVEDPWRVGVILSALVSLKDVHRLSPGVGFEELCPEDQGIILGIVESRRAAQKMRIRKEWRRDFLESRLSVVAWLIICPPVGFYALWVTPHFSGGMKTFLAFVGIIALAKWNAFLRAAWG